MNDKKKFPSQHREGLDYIYRVTSDKPTQTRKIVDAADQAASKVGEILKLANRAGLMSGDGNGHWTRVEDVKRTEFRDRVVRQWFIESGEFRMREAVDYFAGFTSASQLFYTVERLRRDETIAIHSERDGSRSPVYTVKEV